MRAMLRRARLLCRPHAEAGLRCVDRRGRLLWRLGTRVAGSAAPPAEPVAFQLSPEQQRALTVMRERIADHLRDSNATEALLLSFSGAAGTGKTTCVRFVADDLRERGWAVGFAAPTHKAAGVLARALNVPREEVLTVASLLGLREGFDERSGAADYRPAGPNRLGSHVVWVVDEASMVSPETLAFIAKGLGPRQAVVFMGDEAQLPPVNCDHSPALQLGDQAPQLTTVFRHGGAVLDLATWIRTRQQVPSFPLRVVEAGGSAVVAHGSAEGWAAAHGVALQASGFDPDAARILGWTNRAVDAENRRVRALIYGADALPFVRGERLLARDPIYGLEAVAGLGPWKAPPIVQRGQELTVAGAEWRIVRVPWEWFAAPEGNPDPLLGAWQVYAVTDGGVPVCFDVICPRSEDSYQQGLRHYAGCKNWSRHYALRRGFASVQPPWALTVHRAQGSQFDGVWLLGADLRKNWNERERVKLWYTAVTRARRAVHLVAD